MISTNDFTHEVLVQTFNVFDQFGKITIELISARRNFTNLRLLT